MILDMQGPNESVDPQSGLPTPTFAIPLAADDGDGTPGLVTPVREVTRIKATNTQTTILNQGNT